MTRLERRVFSRSLAIGALLTLMVLAASAFGLLDSLEYWLYDQRAIYCQLAEPAAHFPIRSSRHRRCVRLPHRAGPLALAAGKAGADS